MVDDRFNQITGVIVDAAIKVHKILGPGLLESACEKCLQFELQRRGYTAARQVEMPLVYEGFKVDLGCRIDLLVEDIVVLECKAVRNLTPIDKAQILSHLKVGNVELLKDGIHRFVV